MQLSFDISFYYFVVKEYNTLTYLNKKYILKQRPFGRVDKNTWSLQEEELEPVKDNELLIKNHFISIDPAMRGWLDNRKSYIPPVEVGDVMRAGTIGEVIETKNDKFQVGDWIVGWHGVQTYALSDGKNDFNLGSQLSLPPEKFLSVLGMTGYTAYFGLLDVGKAREGDTVAVSAAAGAVGSVVGQIAKIKGMKVIGTAGSDEKCKYLKDTLGFDHAVNYKSPDFIKQILAASKGGIDVYFDNVGGDMLDLMLTRLNLHARVVICGAISQYNNEGRIQGPSNYLSLLVNRASMQGFVVFDYKDRYMEAAMQLSQWMAEGRLKSREHIVEGIESFPKAFDLLFSGDKMGKLLLKLH